MGPRGRQREPIRDCARPQGCAFWGSARLESAVTLERMGPAWDLETVTKRRSPPQSPPASDATAGGGADLLRLGSSPAFPSRFRSPLHPVCQLAVAQAWESAASLQRPLPGLGPSRGPPRPPAAERAEGPERGDAPRAAAPRPGGLGVGKGRLQGARGTESPWRGCAGPRARTAHTAARASPRGVSPVAAQKETCSGVPPRAAVRARTEGEAAVTVCWEPVAWQPEAAHYRGHSD